MFRVKQFWDLGFGVLQGLQLGLLSGVDCEAPKGLSVTIQAWGFCKGLGHCFFRLRGLRFGDALALGNGLLGLGDLGSFSLGFRAWVS